MQMDPAADKRFKEDKGVHQHALSWLIQSTGFDEVSPVVAVSFTRFALKDDTTRLGSGSSRAKTTSRLLSRIYGSFEKPSEKEKGYVLPRADGENGENCHVRRLGRRASSAGILQRPNSDQNCARHDVLPKGFGAPGLP
ncbi:hypothetical protein Bca52824_086218 [Brassica carinata]|uniref:Uncharacterized protein n=1 Tax=Brassica carinata TaxID=52824 RepID=A0A8X7P8K7_BRACI|nr:hypothetical protein Bca52824_086218 [Brassica carinata]